MPVMEAVEASKDQTEWTSVEEELAWYKEWVNRAAEVCQQAARGDLEPRLLHAPSKGDMGVMLHSINHLLDMTDAFVREARASLEYASQGKYFRRVVLRGMHGSFRHASQVINEATEEMARQAKALQDSERRRKELSLELEQVISTLASSATEMRATAETLAKMAQQTTSEAANVSAAAEQTSASMSNVAGSTQQLKHAFDAVDEKTQQCAELAKKATRQAEDATPTMENLKSVSERVGGVVNLIAQIARQTNLLALNATIEAARSGEAGRGFAVVASEVKELARRTATATEEIGAEIQRMQDATSQVGGTLTEICGQIQRIDGISEEIAAATQEQSQATNEINQNTMQAARGTQEVSRSVHSVSEVARQTQECASQLLQAADELSRQSENLRSRMGDLLEGIR